MLNRIINNSIVVLVVTNLLIIIYNTLLAYLNFLYPAKVAEKLFRDIASPQPFQISLYLGLIIVFVLAIWLGSRIVKIPPSQPHSPFLFGAKLIVLALLVILFLSKLGQYPLSLDSYPYPPRADRTIYGIVFLVVMACMSFLLIECSLLDRMLTSVKKKRFLLYGSVIVLLGVLTFEPRFPLIPHDYSFFFGPITEIAAGKTVYTDIPSQHGFLSILSFAFLYKISLFDLFSLPLFIWLLYTIEYFLCFYLLFRISRSVTLALIGLFSILTANYFSLYHLPASVLQIGPIRWLPLLFVLFLYFRLKNIIHPLLVLAIAVLSLWVVDAGIALVLGYALTLFILFLTRRIDFRQSVKTFLLLFLWYILILFVIQLGHLLLGYKAVDFFNLFTTLRKYAVLGIAQIPIEPKTFFWIFILIYFASIMYIFRNQEILHHVGDTKGRDPTSAQDSNTRNYRNRIEEHYSEKDNIRGKDKSEHLWEGISGQNLHDMVLLFSANLSLFAAIYYVGRSHPHNLYHISLFFLLTAFILIGILLSKVKLTPAIRFILYSLLCIIFIAFPAYLRNPTLAEMMLTKYNKFTQGDVFESETKILVDKTYRDHGAFIKRNIHEDSTVILSPDDTYLFSLIAKKNLLDANPQVGIDTASDMEFALKNITRPCPKKLVVDCEIVHRCVSYPKLNHGFNISPFILDALEKKCRIKYEPVKCTKKICIVERIP